jgi:hypothetical protein
MDVDSQTERLVRMDVQKARHVGRGPQTCAFWDLVQM